MATALEDKVCQWLLTEAAYPLVITDAAGAIVLSNPAAQGLFGYSQEELKGLPVESLMPECFRDRHRQDRAADSCDPRKRPMNAGRLLHARHRDGSEFEAEISLNPIENGLVLVTIQELTERKRAEAALQQSEARFRSTFEQAAVGIAHVAPDGRWLRVNRKLCEILGYSREELLARTFQDITHPDDLDADLDYVRRMLAHQIDTYSMEKRYIRKDGGAIWINLTVALTRKPDGTPDYFISVVEDIRARKQAEAALSESDEKLKLFIEHAPAALAMFDRQMHYLAASHRWMEDYFLGDRDIIGRSHYEIFPEITEHWKAVHRRGLAGEIVQADEDRFERSDGTIQWLHWGVRPWRTADGAVGGIVIFTEDITERKRAEEALRESEVRYHSTLDNMLEGCQIIGFDWRYRYLNNAVALQTKQKKEALLGRSMTEVFPGIEQTPLFAELTRCMNERVAAHLENEFVFPGGSKSKSWFELSIQPVPEGVFILSIDISERKRGEAALQAMCTEMEQLMRFHVASQTVSALAHELNQPLNAVTAYAEAAQRLLRSGNPQPERLLHAVEGSAQQAQRAGRVVRELLAFMKLGEVQTEPVDLNALVRQVLDRVDADGYGGFQTRLKLLPDLACVSANRLQLKKVLVNLIENGIEAMRDAGISARSIAIAVSTHADGTMAQVTVRDSGPGIDAHTLHRIFEPFFTTKPKGLGMGLAISRAIIESHGGQLWVESEPGSGASFHFTLPFAP